MRKHQFLLRLRSRPRRLRPVALMFSVRDRSKEQLPEQFRKLHPPLLLHQRAPRLTACCLIWQGKRIHPGCFSFMPRDVRPKIAHPYFHF